MRIESRLTHPLYELSSDVCCVGRSFLKSFNVLLFSNRVTVSLWWKPDIYSFSAYNIYSTVYLSIIIPTNSQTLRHKCRIVCYVCYSMCVVYLFKLLESIHLPGTVNVQQLYIYLFICSYKTYNFVETFIQNAFQYQECFTVHAYLVGVAPLGIEPLA